MLDAIVAGAGPAGSIAALVLARAGARVLIVDREEFPRDKLCGDTLNPGAVRLLDSLDIGAGARSRAMPLRGMDVTGPRASVRAVYGTSESGLAITRRELDRWLLDEAIHAGARFESGLTVTRPLIESSGPRGVVRGLVLRRAGSTEELRMPASMTIAADGRQSRLARGLGLVSPSRRLRRWAFGTYASGVAGMSDFGEMHIRPGWYAGLAPVGGGLVNICVVRAIGGKRLRPLEVIQEAIRSESVLTSRFVGAEVDPRVRVLGPLSVDVHSPGVCGLLLAGDASGFVDPMTGDGLNLAMRSAILAAEEALRALETGEFEGAISRLAAARRRWFGSKLRFNRAVRRLVDSPVAVDVASLGAIFLPGLVRHAIRYAGDAA